jgi:hypothetical protein
MRLFWVDLALILSAASVRSGYVSKKAAGDTITTQLESIAR